MLYILWSFGTYILGPFGTFFPALVCCTKKNLATPARNNKLYDHCAHLLVQPVLGVGGIHKFRVSPLVSDFTLDKNFPPKN
jgi:hypothetical protein